MDPYKAYIIPQIHCADNIYFVCNVCNEKTLFVTPPPVHQLCCTCIPKFHTLYLSFLCVFLDLPTLLDLHTLTVLGGSTNI